MAGIYEYMTIAAFVGKRVRQNKLSEITSWSGEGTGRYSDCEEYIVALDCIANIPELALAFQITEKEISEWKNECAHFDLHVYAKDGMLIGVHISKMRKTELLPDGYETEPECQEVQLVGWILRSITE